MLFEWSAECGTDDPVLVVPWTADPTHPEAGTFVDLRADPYDLDRIPEAEHHAALLQALRALNATRSPVFTAKCDAWPMSDSEVADAQFGLDLTDAEASVGFASYIDILWRDRALFVSFAQQEGRLGRLRRLLEPVEAPYALIDAIVRPSLIDFTGPQEGFAISLYAKSLGATEAAAYAGWETALQSVVSVLRSRDFTGV